MRLLTRNIALTLVFSAILVGAPEAHAQQSVKVVNTTAQPVPTAAQGTTHISGTVQVTNTSLPVTGSVKVTNTSLPVTGSVHITNSSLPVTGTVTAGNLPLDSNGNVRTSVAPDTTKYQFVSIVALEVSGCSNSYGLDFCTYNGTQYVPIEQTLTTLSAQGYELVSIVNFPPPGAGEQTMLYTLRLPVP